MEKMNRRGRNWMVLFGKIHSWAFFFRKKIHGFLRENSCLGKRVSLREKKIFLKIRQNSETAAFSGSSSVVAVCVEKNSELTVKWALDNLVFEGDQLIILLCPIVAIQTAMGNMPIAQVCSDVVAAYVQDVASQTLKLLWHLQQMCNAKKVQPEIIVLEDHNIPKAILKYISHSRISNLVIGSSRHLIRRKLKGHHMPASIAMEASNFCSVYVISKGKLTSVHQSNSSAQDNSSYGSGHSLLSGEKTGYRVSEPSETTTNDGSSNRGRDFEGIFVSKPDMETKLERLKIELQDTRETYRDAIAFHEAIVAKYKACLNAQLIEELRRMEETKDASELDDQRCREYSIEQIEFATDFFSGSLKIGEGGYGPVYKGSLDHTAVAIKVLRKDAAPGRDEFRREIEVLSRIHHPHMLLLLGTCPERGCLVYEYMENGSLEDWLFHSGEKYSLPWFIRFRIASEIASALHFLHTAKPEPVVHRDLKPANILLDHNFVSKIGDVGLARLVPPTVSCSVTEYNNTVVVGTFCYMDPEYVRTGTLRPASDLYAFGIILLQLLTGETPMAIVQKVLTAMKAGSFSEILDKTAGEWPPKETIEFAKLALACTELRRRDRPDLESVVLPELERFRDLDVVAHPIAAKRQT